MEDFVFSDPELANRLDSSANPRSVKEKLLLRQDGEHLDVSLYLAPEVVEHLSEEDPTERLHAGNFEDFLLALEGVSHFLYLIWSAAYNKPVSLVELELQAEVDKYVAAATLLGQQRGGYVPLRLHSWLFDAPVFDKTLRREELQRYRDASHYAAKYCRHLLARYRGSVGSEAILSELRRFYRLPRSAKIRHIER